MKSQSSDVKQNPQHPQKSSPCSRRLENKKETSAGEAEPTPMRYIG